MSTSNSFKLKQLQFEYNTPSLKPITVEPTPKSLFLQNLHSQISNHKSQLQNPHSNLVLDFEHVSAFAAGSNNYIFPRYPVTRATWFQKFKNIFNTEPRIKNKNLVPSFKKTTKTTLNPRTWLAIISAGFLIIVISTMVFGSQQGPASKNVDATSPLNLSESSSSSDSPQLSNNSSSVSNTGQPFAISPQSSEVPKSASGLFDVQSYNRAAEILLSHADKLSQEQAQNNLKKTEETRIIAKIDNYVTQYRSYKAFNKDHEAPVTPDIFWQVSQDYQTPLKYMLAIARVESQFGTNRFNSLGQPNRIGQNQNMYSLGLNDRGDNNVQDSWEDGVAAFGKWYMKMEERGISDCQKWRLFNPNGDNCQRVESLAAEIQNYLDE